MNSSVFGYENAIRIAAANINPRFRRIDTLERYVYGTQYEGREHFLSKESDTPLVERAPCIVYPIVQAAIQSHTDFIVGEGKFPRITSFTSEDDREFDPDYGLSEEDSYVLDKFITHVIKQSRFETVCYQLIQESAGVGSVAVLCGVRQGKLFAESIPSKWCTPIFNPTTGSLLSLEIRYPFIKEEWSDAHRRWEYKCRLYKRVINEVSDIVYKPAQANEDGSEPFWSVDKQASTVHNLGFCPVQWYPFLKKCASIEEVDGKPIHNNLLDEIDALNFVLSQAYRATLYAGDPQLIETGVDDEDKPNAGGRHARAVILPGDSKSPYPDLQYGRFGVERYGPDKVRKKGVSEIWSFASPQAKVELLTLPGDAIQSIHDQAASLRSKICEALCVLWIDPETAKLASDISGKALELLYKRQTSFCDQIRSDFGDNCLLPMLHMLIRIAYTVHSQKHGSLSVPGLSKVANLLQRFEVLSQSQEKGVVKQWIQPHLDLIWPKYFTPTDADGLQVAQMIQTILPLGLITKEMALEKLKSFFPFNSPKDVLNAVLEEREEEDSTEVQVEDTADSLGQEPPESSPQSISEPPSEKTLKNS